MFCKCTNSIPEARYRLGYKTCLSCSTEERWSAVPVINHKTGNEIQIIKDREVAEEFMRKSARVGFGTMRGMTSSCKRKAVSTQSKREIAKPAPVVAQKIVSVKMLPNRFEEVGSKVMDLIEKDFIDAARSLVASAFESREIWGVHVKQLGEIIDAFAEQKKLQILDFNKN
jgi:hypothetical protein